MLCAVKRSVMRIIVLPVGRCRFLEENESGLVAVWRFKPILSAGLRFHSHLSGGLRLRNYRAVAGNHKFSSRFSVFACFCGGYSNSLKLLSLI